jgi:hypothetical protein
VPDFIHGLDLSEAFYFEVIAPLLASSFPQLPHSAALIGWGSEVLGFDDTQSTDHNWGPRLQLFLTEEAFHTHRNQINQALNESLPPAFRGYPTNFPLVVNADQRAPSDAPASHNVDLETVRGYFARYLGWDPHADITAADWLSFSEHKLLAVTSGRVFHDGLGQLEPIRQKFSYYPRDVWLYLLAAQWTKLQEEQAFVGRSGDAGDDLGSRLIAARQVKLLMGLCFLMERKYAPYSKWFGTAFSRLACAPELTPIFEQVLQASRWQERQEGLARAYEVVARMHNALNLTAPMREAPALYYDRPYWVLGDDRYAKELLKAVSSEAIKTVSNL